MNLTGKYHVKTMLSLSPLSSEVGVGGRRERVCFIFLLLLYLQSKLLLKTIKNDLRGSIVYRYDEKIIHTVTTFNIEAIKGI